MSDNTQEPAYLKQLRGIGERLNKVHQRLSLVVHHADGSDVVAPLASAWQPWPDLPGVRVFHVPHWAGEPGAFLIICQVEAGVQSLGAHLDESRLIALLDGELTAAGHPYRRGQMLWIAPGEPLDWRTECGYLAAILYDVPPHDIDADLLPPS